MQFPPIDPTFGWHEIDEHTLTLRGDGDTSLTFVARNVLSCSDEIHSPVAIALDTTFHTSDLPAPLHYQKPVGCYLSLNEKRGELKALRNGVTKEVRFLMEGLDFRIYQHQSERTLCVEGVFSNVLATGWWPWPEQPRDIGDWLLDHNPLACSIRFAFVSSLIDPPWLDNFVRDIDGLLAHLRQFEQP